MVGVEVGFLERLLALDAFAFVEREREMQAAAAGGLIYLLSEELKLALGLLLLRVGDEWLILSETNLSDLAFDLH